MAKRYRPDSRVSYRLEERVPVGRYQLVGTPEWFSDCFSSEYVTRHQEDILRVSNASDIRPVLETLQAGTALNIDTESSGIREMDGLDAVSPTSRLLLFQIGIRNVAKNYSKLYIVQPELIREFKSLLEDESRFKVLQNAVHDFRFLYAKHGVCLTNIFCTMLAEQMLTAGIEGVGVGLADLARKYPPYRLISKNVREEFIRHSGPFTESQLFYSARDIFILPDIAKSQYQLLQRYQMWKTAQTEFGNIPATAEMGLVGVQLEPEYLLETLEYHALKCDQEAKKIFDIWNAELVRLGKQETDLFGAVYEQFNLGSSQAKKEAFQRIGVDIESTDTDLLKELDHPMAGPMIAWSGHNKIVSNYGQSMVDKIHWFTKRFHPDFDQLGAGESAQRAGRDKKETIATGRYSSNFQILPRPEKTLEPISGEELEQVSRFFADKLAGLQNKDVAA